MRGFWSHVVSVQSKSFQIAQVSRPIVLGLLGDRQRRSMIGPNGLVDCFFLNLRVILTFFPFFTPTVTLPYFFFNRRLNIKVRAFRGKHFLFPFSFQCLPFSKIMVVFFWCVPSGEVKYWHRTIRVTVRCLHGRQLRTDASTVKHCFYTHQRAKRSILGASYVFECKSN